VNPPQFSVRAAMGAAGVVQRALSGCDVLRVYPDFEDWSDSIVDMLLVCALHERCTSEKNNERIGCKGRVETERHPH
jgi:hypothetical protein